MNAKTPQLEQQLDGLMTNYENALIAAAQAPDKDKATINSQVEVISAQLVEFFATDAVVAALDELKDLRSAEYEKIGELFAEGKISDSELDERIEAIENSPKYRLLGLATELGAFALEDVSVEKISEDDDIDPEFKPFVPVKVTPETIDELSNSDDTDLEPEEIELISEVATREFTAIEPETVIFAESNTDDVDDEQEPIDILDKATLVEVEMAFEAIDSDPTPDAVFVKELENEDSKVILPEIAESEAITQEVEINAETDKHELTIDEAMIFTEEVADITKGKDELKVIAPKYLLKSSLKKAAETDLRYITPEMRKKAVSSILEILDSEDPLLSFITDAESSPEMFDFADYASSIVESAKWAAVKSQLLESIQVEEESSALPVTTATISAEPAIFTPEIKSEVEDEKTEPEIKIEKEPEVKEEPKVEIVEPESKEAEIIEIQPKIEEKIEQQAVANAVEVLVETDNLFEGEISLAEFRSRTGIDTDVFIDVYRSGILVLDEEEKNIAIREIKINAAEAILLQLHATNPKLLSNSDDTVKARILSSVNSELNLQTQQKAA